MGQYLVIGNWKQSYLVRSENRGCSWGLGVWYLAKTWGLVIGDWGWGQSCYLSRDLDMIKP